MKSRIVQQGPEKIQVSITWRVEIAEVRTFCKEQERFDKNNLVWSVKLKITPSLYDHNVKPQIETETFRSGKYNNASVWEQRSNS